VWGVLGIIESITEIADLKIEPVASMNGKGGQLGISAMISALGGCFEMDGYKVVTDAHTFHVLISNGQSCCESWGYIQSEDDLSRFVGAELREVILTDTALNKAAVEKSDYYDGDCGGIQFVDFLTDKGTFQLAVYNAHNGYYGHPIVVAKDEEILLQETL
jgi:hypothetical protein